MLTWFCTSYSDSTLGMRSPVVSFKSLWTSPTFMMENKPIKAMISASRPKPSVRRCDIFRSLRFMTFPVFLGI